MYVGRGCGVGVGVGVLCVGRVVWWGVCLVCVCATVLVPDVSLCVCVCVCVCVRVCVEICTSTSMTMGGGMSDFPLPSFQQLHSGVGDTGSGLFV